MNKTSTTNTSIINNHNTTMGFTNTNNTNSYTNNSSSAADQILEINNPGSIQSHSYEQLNVVTNSVALLSQRSTDSLNLNHLDNPLTMNNNYDFYEHNKKISQDHHYINSHYSQQHQQHFGLQSMYQDMGHGIMLTENGHMDYSNGEQSQQQQQTQDRHFSGPSGSSLESIGSAGVNVFTPNNNSGSFIDEDVEVNENTSNILLSIYQRDLQPNKVIKQEMLYQNQGMLNNNNNLGYHHDMYDNGGVYNSTNNQHVVMPGLNELSTTTPFGPTTTVTNNNNNKRTSQHQTTSTVTAKHVLPNFTSPESAFYQYQNRMEAQLCQVCGESAAGFHHGAYVCEACKKFFMRHSLTDSKLQTACPTGGKCSVTKGNRGKCQQCRFKKCLEIGMFLKDPDSQNDVDISNIPCRVCGGRSSGFHFGALTCEGCKGFFRRTEGTNARLVCVGGQDNCAITPRSRNACKSCRFKRCIAVGMSKVGSRIGRQPNAVKYHCAMEIMQLQVMKSVLSTTTPATSTTESPANAPSVSSVSSPLTSAGRHSGTTPPNSTSSSSASPMVVQKSSVLSENQKTLLDASGWPIHNVNGSDYSQPSSVNQDSSTMKSLRRRASSTLTQQSSSTSSSDGRRSAKELRLDNGYQQTHQQIQDMHLNYETTADGGHLNHGHQPQQNHHHLTYDNSHFINNNNNNNTSVFAFNQNNQPEHQQELLFGANIQLNELPNMFADCHNGDSLSGPFPSPSLSLNELNHSELNTIELNGTILKFIYSMKSAIEFLELPRNYLRSKYNLSGMPPDDYTCDVTIWNHVMNHFEVQSQIVVDFAKLIPGFNQLTMSGKSGLLRDAIYSIILLFLSRDFNSKNYDFNFFDFNQSETSVILHHYPTFNCVAEHLKISGSFVQSLLLTSTELAIFCVVELLKNYNKLKQPECSDAMGLYLLAKQALVYLINAKSDHNQMGNKVPIGNKPTLTRISQIQSMSDMLSGMNKEHQSILTELRKKRHDLHYPELYVEIFQSADEKTTSLSLNTSMGYHGQPSSSSANSSTSGIKTENEDVLDEQIHMNQTGSNLCGEQDFLSQPS